MSDELEFVFLSAKDVRVTVNGEPFTVPEPPEIQTLGSTRCIGTMEFDVDGFVLDYSKDRLTA